MIYLFYCNTCGRVTDVGQSCDCNRATKDYYGDTLLDHPHHGSTISVDRVLAPPRPASRYTRRFVPELFRPSTSKQR